MSARGTSAVRKMATAQMLQVCRIERLAKPTYDANLIASPGTRSVVYTGQCRIWEQRSPSMVRITNTDFLAYQTMLSLPWDTAANQQVLDEVEITASPTDDSWVGARFRIQSLVQGGQMRATRTYVLERITPRP